jgi:NADPH:quinone reductase-like Zn-dependent oxidoreductase
MNSSILPRTVLSNPSRLKISRYKAQKIISLSASIISIVSTTKSFRHSIPYRPVKTSLQPQYEFPAKMSTTSIPSKVRSVFQPDINTTDLILTDLPLHPAKEGTDEHLIKVYATSPCAGELLWARDYPSIMSVDRVAVPCNDLSGVVVTAPTSSPFQPGTEIYTRTPAARTGNARAYTIALTSELALKPKNLSWEEAASVPLSAFTAYQALFTQGGLKLGWKDASGKAENAKKRVLITAGAGGVGVWLVQLARAAGVGEIVAIVGPDNVDFVKSLGATEVINYKQKSLGQWVADGASKVDLVVDLLGKQTLADSWAAIKDGGTLLSIRELPESRKPKTNAPKDVTSSFFIMEPDGWQLKDVAELLEAGKARAIVDSVWKLEEFKEAFAKLEGGHARGKVIIKVQE